MAYTAAEQEAAAASVKPILWARLSVKHTKKTCALSCAVPFIALAIVIATGAIVFNSPEGNDYVIRNDKRTLLEDGREAARDEYPYRGGDALPAGEDGLPVEEEAPREETPRADYNSFLSLAILFRGRVGPDGPVGIMNDTSEDATNVLTKKGLALMKKAEDELLDDPEFKKYCRYDPSSRDCAGNILDCALPRSILLSEHLYGEWVGEGIDRRPCARKEDHEVSDEDFEKFMSSLFRDGSDGEQQVNPVFSPYIGIDLSSENPRTWITKSIFDVGEPFEGYSNIDDRPDEQQQDYDSWGRDMATRLQELTTSEIDVFLIGPALLNASFNSVVIRDLSFSIAAIFLVFLVIWLHTTSVYLAGTAMAQIFLAFPFAYVFYKFVFRQDYFAALQILVVFLILGIGADDVFVFTDAWKQSAVVLGSGCDLVTRMSWTYRRAVKAMSVTSLTTAAAFFVTATSPIMPIGTLGIWAGVLIIFQFFLVITIYPCAVVTWHRFWRLRKISRCFRKTDGNLSSSSQKNDTNEAQSNAGEAGEKSNTNENVEGSHSVPIWARCLPARWRPERKPRGVDEYRTIEKFFRGPWINFVNRFRYALLLFAVALVGVSAYLATKLSPPEENESFLPKSNNLRTALETVEDSFSTSEADSLLRVRVTWGILGTDRTGTSKFDPSEPGKAELDTNFDLRSAEAQQHVLNACSFFGDQENLIFQEPTIGPDERIECWIRKFKDWRSTKGKENFETYETESALIAEIIEFGNEPDDDGNTPNLGFLTGQHVAFTEDRTRIVFTEVRFVSNLKAAEPYKIMWPVYQEWQQQLSIFNGKAPESVSKEIGNAIATGGYSWTWQVTQRTLVRSMFVGIAVMLPVAFAALVLSTLNWVVALLTTLTIASIMTILLGLISLLGWDLGITESIGVVIAIGYSFDGAAHIATAYVESRDIGRFDRTRDALTDLGISILFGALSTLLAGFMLFPAIIIFFVKFAALIVATITLSLVFSLMFLPALLLVLGPVGEFGSFAAVSRTIRSCFSKDRSTQNSVKQESVAEEKIVNESQDGVIS